MMDVAGAESMLLTGLTDSILSIGKTFGKKN